MPATAIVATHKRSGLSPLSVLGILILMGAIGFAVARLARPRTVWIGQTSPGSTAPTRDHAPGGMPVLRMKPAPVSAGFGGCPAEGDGGDPQLNRLKNRVDSAEWIPVSLDSILGLSWPADVVRHRRRSDWHRQDAAAVGRFEGIPVTVEGYFVGARQSGPESTNCHGADSRFRDWHLWLATRPGKEHRRAVVVEATPIMRASHRRWTLTAVRRLARDSTLVRVSGWLLLDPEHPEEVRRTRGTIWEIHPILRIEAHRGGHWVDIQNFRR